MLEFDVMKYSIIVSEIYSKPGDPEKMLYVDKTGELFIGPKRNVNIGQIYEIEVSEKLLGTQYRSIISWLDTESTSG